MKIMSLLSITALALLLALAAVQPAPMLAAPLADGFDFPLDRDGTASQISEFGSYNERNLLLNQPKDMDSCYNKLESELQHAGEDWEGAPGDAVHAVADGRVVWSGNTNNFNGVVIIEHTLPAHVSTPWNTNKIYSMYGRLDATSLVQAGTEVGRRQTIGYLQDIGEHSHVHFELRRYANMQDAPDEVNGYPFCNTSWAGQGRTDTDTHPDWFGYTHPSNWINSHRTIIIPPPNAPQLLSPANNATIGEGNPITLAWSGNGDEYQVEVRRGTTVVASFDWQSATSVEINTLPAGYTYTWLVKARNSTGTSDWSDSRTFSVKLAAPTQVVAQVDDCEQITLSWDDTSNNEDGYKIYRNGTLIKTTGANVESYTDASVAADTSYSYSIEAYRGSAESERIDAAPVRTSKCQTNPPTVVWTKPVGDEGVLRMGSGTVQLEVQVTNMPAGGKIRFSRWDEPNAKFIPIEEDAAAPFQATLNVSSLNMRWNEIDAEVVGADGKIISATRKYFFLYRMANVFLPIVYK